MLFTDEIHRHAAGHRGDPLSRDGGLRGRHHHRPGPGARSVKVAVAEVHLGRRHDARRPAHVAAARALRHRAPARLLRRVRTSRKSCGVRRASWASPIDEPAAARSGATVARHTAHREPPAAARARLRAGARPTAPSRWTWRVPRCRLLEVDDQGFDEMDRKLLRTIIDKFGGGPVGVNSIAAAINEERDAIEDIYEPLLIQGGFLDRTPRGRVATARAYECFRAHRSQEGSSTVVNPSSARRLACAHLQPGDLRAAEGPHERRPREDGRDDATNGSCSGRASVSATSSIPASPPPTWRSEAARVAVERAGLTPDEIDFIVVGTTTPDTMFPSTRLPAAGTRSAPRMRWGYDLLGRVFRRSPTRSRRRANYGGGRRAASTRSSSAPTLCSSIIDYTDRTTCVMFGDGAGAAVVEASRRRQRRHHRLRELRGRQRRPGVVHARRRQPCCPRRTRPSTSGCTT